LYTKTSPTVHPAGNDEESKDKKKRRRIHESVVSRSVTTHRIPAEFHVTARDKSKTNSKLHLLNETTSP
jgi:hypothetical protein